jgi:hypothetical protein
VRIEILPHSGRQQALACDLRIISNANPIEALAYITSLLIRPGDIVAKWEKKYRVVNLPDDTRRKFSDWVIKLAVEARKIITDR